MKFFTVNNKILYRRALGILCEPQNEPVKDNRDKIINICIPFGLFRGLAHLLTISV